MSAARVGTLRAGIVLLAVTFAGIHSLVLSDRFAHLTGDGWVGRRLPSLTLTLADGRVRPVPQPGPPLVLLAWASWCEPCHAEIRRLLDLQYSKTVVFGVVLLNFGESADVVRTHAADFGPGHPAIALDPEREIANRLQIGRLPTTILVDTTGRVVYRAEGGDQSHVEEIERRVKLAYEAAAHGL